MKSLYLIRHAKSSWSFDLDDHDRPLGKRGRKDVHKMGQHLLQNQPVPDILISSTASRALYTALHICDHWGLDEGRIKLDQGLYHAGASEILQIVQKAPECERLAIFGHNPGFTNVANAMANLDFDNVPTCGVVGINFNIRYWKDVKFGEGMLNFFYFPKGI
ncbi:phosphohistidine phosphatase [Ekhidna lutea]|uniref:Phosphohistidine phosphatase n=1 Tax=Ekhidna lutea TaxID=447679 RepID=A0A239KCZ9_EKHLU|nr:histidine phosphatase family protein [Ekhidna lutea]SNT15628.1 phosphohistidine phosphatase [Ekhidna lutea]